VLCRIFGRVRPAVDAFDSPDKIVSDKKRVLFICTHNAARSQMAEGLLDALHGDHYEAFSAGTEPGVVSPYAVKVMAEIGIDILHHRSKSLSAFLDQRFDYVVTVCDNAKESCPVFPGGRQRIHKSFEDPSTFAGSEEEIMAGFRGIRDEIRSWIENEFINLNYDNSGL
jgi:arsenate reductase (thioredoxin)